MKKKVLLTGGTSGLGKAIIESFAKNEYDVIFTYHSNETEAKNIKKEIEKKYNIKIEYYSLDIKDDKSIDNLVSKIDSVDVLVNNAAYNLDNNIFEKDRNQFLEVLNTNLVGPFILCNKLYPILKKCNGNIVNIASTNGIDTMYEESADYDASKAGLINLTKNLASSYAPDVRVNAVAPGWINTSSTIDMNPNFRASEMKKIGLNRFAEPCEVAEAVYFLASERASYINGSILRVDGGIKYGN